MKACHNYSFKKCLCYLCKVTTSTNDSRSWNKGKIYSSGVHLSIAEGELYANVSQRVHRGRGWQLGQFRGLCYIADLWENKKVSAPGDIAEFDFCEMKTDLQSDHDKCNLSEKNNADKESRNSRESERNRLGFFRQAEC